MGIQLRRSHPRNSLIPSSINFTVLEYWARTNFKLTHGMAYINLAPAFVNHLLAGFKGRRNSNDSDFGHSRDGYPIYLRLYGMPCWNPWGGSMRNSMVTVPSHKQLCRFHRNPQLGEMQSSALGSSNFLIQVLCHTRQLHQVGIQKTYES